MLDLNKFGLCCQIRYNAKNEASTPSSAASIVEEGRSQSWDWVGLQGEGDIPDSRQGFENNFMYVGNLLHRRDRTGEALASNNPRAQPHYFNA